MDATDVDIESRWRNALKDTIVLARNALLNRKPVPLIERGLDFAVAPGKTLQN